MSDDVSGVDDELRRLARAASSDERAAVAPPDTEAALAAVRARLDGRAPRSARSGGRWLLVAAAAAVIAAVVAALVVVRPDATSDDRLASGSTADDTGAPVTSDIDPVPSPTESGGPTTTVTPATTTTIPDAPSIVLDRAGNELARFQLVDGRVVNGGDPTDFTEALLDYLLHRSSILGESAEERVDRLVRGGLDIHTTLDPQLQAAAEAARNQLPANEAGIDAAVISIDTATGAIRAMVGGERGDPAANRGNMVLTPRPTGSAVNQFVLAAGLQAGAQPDDLIDGRRGCTFPATGPDEMDVQINGGVAGFIGPLREIFARSISCGSVRLSHAVGLDRMVATIYRLAESPYLFDGQSSEVRAPVRPVADLAVGVNEMTPLDLASGMQSIANVGNHASPYYVDHIDTADGTRWYTHDVAFTPVLDRDAALRAVDVLEDTITYGTARRHPLADGRPAIGVTGTVQDNTDAWFVGATPELTTAVWVGDPVAPTPMVAIPEFLEADTVKVQGGTFPALIWKTFMDAALVDSTIQDWDAPPPPERPNARLVVPGVECVLAIDGATVAAPSIEELGTTVPPGVVDPDHPVPSVDPALFEDGCR